MANRNPGGSLSLASLKRSNERTMLSVNFNVAPWAKQRALCGHDDPVPQPVERRRSNRAVGDSIHRLMKRSVAHDGTPMIARLSGRLCRLRESPKLRQLGRGNLPLAHAFSGKFSV